MLFIILRTKTKNLSKEKINEFLCNDLKKPKDE